MLPKGIKNRARLKSMRFAALEHSDDDMYPKRVYITVN
jgi:hypothetical protein